ncbi:unnamed protein product [Ceutorhynchus assimilis]|uniref:15-hydroxyprostaglandin dehydrogenase [NAD(+)]-like n=1 Tax=Ceutorhynchus assimilis TaxID=467358 RepID=A0A9N9QJC6_9CUCU|nr:unnamed protein product [Ceutorhynchus assimilis]
MEGFDIHDTVALVTGGASGLGFQYSLALLEKGARGVTLVDILPDDAGSKAIDEIERKFGKNKAIFVEADVTNYQKLEDAFKKTVETFKNIDILINNAGIANDAIWQRELTVNINGTIHGILLGMDHYIPKYKSRSEGLILNVSSISGIQPFATRPIYTATKFAIHAMTLSWGLPAHYNRTRVRVVGVCPGFTITSMTSGTLNRCLSSEYKVNEARELDALPKQKPEELVPNVIKIIEKAPPGTVWVAEGAEPAYQYEMKDRFNMEKVYLE